MQFTKTPPIITFGSIYRRYHRCLWESFCKLTYRYWTQLYIFVSIYSVKCCTASTWRPMFHAICSIYIKENLAIMTMQHQYCNLFPSAIRLHCWSRAVYLFWKYKHRHITHSPLFPTLICISKETLICSASIVCWSKRNSQWNNFSVYTYKCFHYTGRHIWYSSVWKEVDSGTGMHCIEPSLRQSWFKPIFLLTIGEQSCDYINSSC